MDDFEVEDLRNRTTDVIAEIDSPTTELDQIMCSDRYHGPIGEVAVVLGIGLAAVTPGGMASATAGDDDSVSSSVESSDSDSSREDAADRDTSGGRDRDGPASRDTDASDAENDTGDTTAGTPSTDSGTNDSDADADGDTDTDAVVETDDADSATDATPGRTADAAPNDTGPTASTTDELGSGAGNGATDPQTATTIGTDAAPSDNSDAGTGARDAGDGAADSPPTADDRTGTGSPPAVRADIRVQPDHDSPVPGEPGADPSVVVTPRTDVATHETTTTEPKRHAFPAPAVPTASGAPPTATPLTEWAQAARAEAPRIGMATLATTLPTEATEVAARIVSNVLGAVGIRQIASTDPLATVESPMFWALAAAWCRRQEKAPAVEAARGLAVAPVTTSQPIEQLSAREASRATDTSSFLTSAATASGPTVGVPDRATGRVLGSVGAPGSYTVTGQASRGTVAVDTTGGFTYTPTQAARASAALDPSGDYDTFTATPASGGAPVTVRVPVSAARMQVTQSSTVGSNPAGVALAGDKAYVTNQSAKTVSVIDAGNTVIATVNVGTTPTGVAANPTGTRVYVTNSGNNSVSVIDTAKNQVVATVGTGLGSAPSAVAVNPAGTRAYVTNSGTNSVTVVNTTNNTVVTTIRNGIGTTPNAVAVNEAGTRAYVTNSGSNSVSVVNTTNNTVVTTIRNGIGVTPTAVTVSRDGTRAYVANSGSNTVSIIDTTNNTVVGNVAVGARPTAVRVSRDGSALYVVTDSDRLTVIDTETRSIVSTVAIDEAAEAGAHAVAISSDGSRLLITDAADSSVRALSLTHVNSAPTATWTPEAPREADGAVRITLTSSDPDGDPVTFSSGGATSGSVVADGVGAFVYTPTPAARALALQTPGPDNDQFGVTVGDGKSATNLAVTVTVSPTPPATSLDIDAVAMGGGPLDAVLVGDRIYVVSQDDVVRVVAAGAVVGNPIPVDWSSTTLAAAPALNRVYVSSPATGFVTVIDTTTDTVVDTLWQLPVDPDFQGYSLSREMVASPDGRRLYTSGEDGTVSVVDTATNTVVSSQRLGYFENLEVSADGRHLYGTSGASVTVIDTATMTRNSVITVGPEWDLTQTRSEFADTTRSVAVSADGKRLYATSRVLMVELASGGYSNGWFIGDATGRTWRVTGDYDIVTVIDVDPASASYGTEIAALRPQAGARDVALGADGRTAYVTGSDGRTVTVVDTTRFTVVGTFDTDASSAGSSRQVLADPDTPGTLYVLDTTDGALYLVTGAPLGQAAAMSV
ncbi:conserved hypothetical protein [Rhodococcus sp. RD6.2]|uniref:hypothetical protein n=1 Tax=Rhodococcus sp. RD6.2 TaxID=260936 RepID=UPI00063B584B|nr:hypothetical protein [Rhodococcus sp. RD6.2]CRK52669.1 conserved hypothetical protein [Rhodococcus sp. RD6.2]